VHRSYPTQPVKVLDAPCFSDDYYFNILDWSSSNCIGIALKNTAYIYNHSVSSVAKLFSLSGGLEVSHITFNKEGTLVSAGLTNGMVEIWDVEKQRALRRMDGHATRTCAASWSSRLLSTGGKDSLILHRDLRMS
jgi:WD40 repeat protein